MSRRAVAARVELLVAAAAAALLAGCTAAPAGPAPLTVVRQEVGGQPAVLVTAPEGTPKALVIYFHGVDTYAVALTRDPDLRRVVDALVADGYAVAGSDAYGNAFGNPASQQAYLDLANAVSANLGTQRTFLLAESMGGLAAVQLAASGKVPDLRGVAGIGPALSTRGAEDSGFLDQAEAAWELPLTEIPDPAALPAQDFAGQRFRFYVTDGDEAAPTSENADAFIAGAGAQARVDLVTCTGEHLDSSCYQPADLVGWFDSLLDSE